MAARQWSLTARWAFRQTNEMPHVLEERLRVSTKFAQRYVNQFSITPAEGVAKAIAFVCGSFVIAMLMLSLVNEQSLLMLTVTPHQSLIWWITVLSAVWVVCRGVVKEQHIFYPHEALESVQLVVKKLPVHFVSNANSSIVLHQFQELFPLRVTQLLLEFVGVVMTPWILLKRIRPNSEAIVAMFRGLSLVDVDHNDINPPDDFDFSVLQSKEIIQNVIKFDEI
jgi:autophagy-related protein 9